MHLYIGLMSGTSLDGIDAVLVSWDTGNRFELLATHHHAIPADHHQAIQALLLPGNNELDREGDVDMRLGRLFADAVSALLKLSGKSAREIRAIGSHGHTVRHRPQATTPFTRQLGNPSVIAELTGITTVADFRSRDMAAGGQGAPLVPGFHAAVFQQPGCDRAIVNIGGIANVTWLPGDNTAITGFDTGPGNTLMDQWVQRHQGSHYDQDGAWAAGGTVSLPLLERMLTDPYFFRTPPKSTGREMFNLEWIASKLTDQLSAQDVQSTLAELTAVTIADALFRLVPQPPHEVYLCGGGAHNRDLVRRLQHRLGAITLANSDVLGLHPDWVEASAFAWLAHQTLSGHPGNVPSVTGARHAVVLGGIYLA
jgi:anhydro-N-acetylmuramic acid kinase